MMFPVVQNKKKYMKISIDELNLTEHEIDLLKEGKTDVEEPKLEVIDVSDWEGDRFLEKHVYFFVLESQKFFRYTCKAVSEIDENTRDLIPAARTWDPLITEVEKKLKPLEYDWVDK